MSFRGGLVALALLAGPPVEAYDTPVFDAKVFSADGIFWSASEKQGLLEALASLAVNFPSNQQVDSDLREKALGIALLIDPFHYSSRRAHEALSNGTTPEKTEYFDSLNAVSETLWRTSSSLLSPPAEPEELLLVPYLMEISLLIHPERPADRMQSFALHSGGKSPGWNRFLTLDAETNPSSRRAQMLALEAGELLRETKRNAKREAEEGEPGTPDGGKDTVTMKPGGIFGVNPDGKPTDPTDPTNPTNPTDRSDPRPAGSPGMPPQTPFEPVQASVPTIRTVRSIDPKPVYGILELTLRPPLTPFEMGRFPFLSEGSPSSYPRLPLFGALRGISLENLEIPVSTAEKLGIEWPARVVGRVSFETEEDLPGPRRLSTTSAWLPALAALRSALGDGELNPDFLLSGSVEEPGAAPRIRAGLDEFLSAIPEEPPLYLLVPELVLEDLVLHLQINENLEILFTTEWVSYEDAESAIATLTSETGADLLEASRTFDEIEEVAGRMPLVELARNAKVQERLEKILRTCPRHLSARAMLEFGTRPVPPEIERMAVANQIAGLVEPFLAVKDDSTDLNDLRGILEANKLALSRMRLDLPTELLDFHGFGSEVLDLAEAYLGMTNNTTSLARQKRRELREAIAKWDVAHAEMFGGE